MTNNKGGNEALVANKADFPQKNTSEHIKIKERLVYWPWQCVSSSSEGVL